MGRKNKLKGQKKKKKPRPQPQPQPQPAGGGAEAGAEGRLAATLKAVDGGLAVLKREFAALGKAEWWWLMDQSLVMLGNRLKLAHFLKVDDFLPPAQARAVRAEVGRAYEAGRLAPGHLAGGVAASGTSYVLPSVRSDRVGWFTGKEAEVGWAALPAYMRKVDTLVDELKAHVPELRAIRHCSRAMVSCYPGGGAHYIRHCDNRGGEKSNGRLLTAILYLNEWKAGDGGELRIFRCLRGSSEGFTDCDGKSLDAHDAGEALADAKPVVVEDVAPVSGRLVVFFSDTRVPHEVVPAQQTRYAVTLWYFAEDPLAKARQASAASHEAEEVRIRQEIERMEQKFGGAALVQAPEAAGVPQVAHSGVADAAPPAEAGGAGPIQGPQLPEEGPGVGPGQGGTGAGAGARVEVEGRVCRVRRRLGAAEAEALRAGRLEVKVCGDRTLVVERTGPGGGEVLRVPLPFPVAADAVAAKYRKARQELVVEARG